MNNIQDSSVIFCLQSFSLHHGEFVLISLDTLRHCCCRKEYHSLSVLWQTADRSRQRLLSFVCRAGVKTDIKQIDDWHLCRDAAGSQHGSTLPRTDKASYELWHHIHCVLRVHGTLGWICPACWQILECNSALGQVFLFVQGPPSCLEKQKKDHLTHHTHCHHDKRG